MPAPETSPYVVTVDYDNGNKLEHPAADERAVCKAFRNLAPLVAGQSATWWVRPTGRSTP